MASILIFLITFAVALPILGSAWKICERILHKKEDKKENEE